MRNGCKITLNFIHIRGVIKVKFFKISFLSINIRQNGHKNNRSKITVFKIFKRNGVQRIKFLKINFHHFLCCFRLLICQRKISKKKFYSCHYFQLLFYYLYISLFFFFSLSVFFRKNNKILCSEKELNSAFIKIA